MFDAPRRLWTSMRAILLLCVGVLAACTDRRPLAQDAWVWRRQWTPPLAAAVASAPTGLDRLRVLAVEQEPDDGRVVVVDVDIDALVAAGRPVLATWRVAGSVPPAVEDIAVVVGRLQAWRARGVDVTGVEIDHDCATGRLPIYRERLMAMRARLPRDLRLAITALPTWREDPTALRAVAAVVDEVTVQVHAVQAPRLFDADRAVDDAVAFARAAGRDVGVALPTYAARVRGGPRLRVDVDEVAAVARALREAPGIERIAWFRLGAADDPGAFAHPTLAALVAGAPTVAALDVGLEVAGDGAVDVVLVNRGTAPASVPARVPFPWPAALAEAAPGVVVDGDAFVVDDAIVPAGARRRLGWLRPAAISPSVASQESP